ncbi:hypothetical protein OE88DRAFT_1662999 [Heliocybe sulcata]|uniref:Ribosomal RNA methyltransferase FtsJ domain-containing protein n=1 Tax=Heliocybe sulcata TaxID=5364 RepID=A0A5C3MVS4_9AGAM|nr:hypothetical protein OE88DRAFT_1662999 [Heliocybe sulcata]
MPETWTDVILETGCPELEHLIALRAKGWQDEKLDQAFTRQRYIADNADKNLNMTWYKRSMTVMEEIDNYARCITPTGPLRFLDLGCCPGGFTSYVLERNGMARGLGVSLPVDQGGHVCCLEARARNRFQLYFADVTSFFQLSSSVIAHPRLRPGPPQMKPATFDLVILDGHQLRTQICDYSQPWDIDRLLISQIILALQCVRTGGKMVVKLTHPERVLTAKIIYLLDILSEDLVTFKPETMHTTRGSFYAIATGVGNGAEGAQMQEMIEGLQRAWLETTFGGVEGNGRNADGSDFDFVITTRDLQATYLGRLVELGRDIWNIQAEALDTWFKRQGIL